MQYSQFHFPFDFPHYQSSQTDTKETATMFLSFSLTQRPDVHIQRDTHDYEDGNEYEYDDDDGDHCQEGWLGRWPWP